MHRHFLLQIDFIEQLFDVLLFDFFFEQLFVFAFVDVLLSLFEFEVVDFDKFLVDKVVFEVRRFRFVVEVLVVVVD